MSKLALTRGPVGSIIYYDRWPTRWTNYTTFNKHEAYQFHMQHHTSRAKLLKMWNKSTANVLKRKVTETKPGRRIHGTQCAWDDAQSDLHITHKPSPRDEAESVNAELTQQNGFLQLHRSLFTLDRDSSINGQPPTHTLRFVDASSATSVSRWAEQ